MFVILFTNIWEFRAKDSSKFIEFLHFGIQIWTRKLT